MKYIYKSFFLTLFIFLILQINTLRSQNSVLASGDWYKLGIAENGIYQLSYQDFIDMGFDVANLDPSKIQIYGNTEGVLPEANNIVVPKGLVQNAIFVSGADDGSFDQGDYVAFYAQGAHEWLYEGPSEQFRYFQHPYAHKNYYFVTIGNEDGFRIEDKASTNQTPLKTITSFRDHQSHEVNLFNFVKSGRKWFGESFEDTGDMVFDFNFPNFDNRFPVKFGIYAAGNSRSSNEIIVTPEGADPQELNIPYVIGSYTYAKEGELRNYFNTTSDLVKFTLSFTPPSPNENAWVDYIEITAVRDLKMHGHQMEFSYNVLLSQNEIFRFKLSNANDQLKIWEVTDPYNTKEITGSQLFNDTLQFGLQLQQTHYFIAFDEEGFFRPEFIAPVENQDLKGLEPFDFLIVTVDDFLGEAERLAAFHEEFDHLRCEVVLKDKIYNEFSSGKQDPTAIRNFLKYHYDKNDSINQPQYLLLFGDASYDFKDILPGNTNIVPVYQSKGSTALTDTYNTDDYYGIMGQLDGDSSKGEVNISIGRFPVNTLEEAKVMVDKTIHYASSLEETMGDWRNKVCFIADDEDSNLHFKDSNRLADTFMLTHPEFNVDKIFLDSYVQANTANGDRYPDVTEAITQGVADGTLFFNYTGHGGHIALTDERVLQIPDILSWENYDKLGVWIVASCEFGPFDNPEHTSAGEHLVLNPRGGGVALFSTTRLAYASYNFRLNEKFHEIAFSRREDGSHYRLGDIIRYAKNKSGNKEKNLNFVLLGDPALKMAYPEYNVETTQLNGNDVSNNLQDTIKARQTVNVNAKVTGLEHQTLTNFNGLVYYKVYAKPSTYFTLANDPKSYKAEFNIVDQIIHQGVARASSGEFEFSFVVPANISSLYGAGKISYYAIEEQSNKSFIDANGGFIDFVIGGIDESIPLDLEGPKIAVFLDDNQFENGGKTSTKPLMLINLSDESGINNVNFGFGKEIKATIDHQDQYYLNDFYKPIDYSYQHGSIQYQLDELSYGSHTLTVKAWDSFDNSSEKSVQFLVVSEERIDIYDLINGPNPVEEYTDIKFSHNQTNESELNVVLKVYDIIGRLVWTYEDQAVVLGNSIEPIRFHQSDSRISELKSGIYSYVVEVGNSEGEKVKGQQKMMIVK